MVRLAKLRLTGSWEKYCKTFGAPREGSALKSLHFLLTDYQDSPSPLRLEPYKVLAGPQAFKKMTLNSACDTPRKSVALHVTTPLDTESLNPAVVLSPGLGAHPAATRYLEEHLASHGYLVIRPSHRGSDFFAVAWKTPIGAFTGLELRYRVLEVERALATLKDDSYKLRVDPDKIGLMGHSFGALTSCVVAGLPARDVRPSEDHSVRALVALSPYGNSFPTQRLGIPLDGFKDLSQPTLFVSGTRDNLFTLGKGPSVHLEPFLMSGARDKKHLVIGGVRHGNFSEIFGWVKIAVRTMLNSSITAFLDAHLLGKDEAKRYLEEELALAAFHYGSWLFDTASTRRAEKSIPGLS